MANATVIKNKALDWLDRMRANCPLPEAMTTDIFALFEKHPASNSAFMLLTIPKKDALRQIEVLDPVWDKNRKKRIETFFGFKEFPSYVIIDQRDEYDSVWTPFFTSLFATEKQNRLMEKYMFDTIGLRPGKGIRLGRESRRVDYHRSTTTRPEYKAILSADPRVVTQVISIAEAKQSDLQDFDELLNYVSIGVGALNELAISGVTQNFRYIVDWFVGPSLDEERVDYSRPALYIVEEDTDDSIVDILPTLSNQALVSVLFQTLFALEAAWLTTGFMHRGIDQVSLNFKNVDKIRGSPFANKTWIFERSVSSTDSIAQEASRYELPSATHGNVLVKISDFHRSRAWVSQKHLSSPGTAAHIAIDPNEDVRALGLLYLMYTKLHEMQTEGFVKILIECLGQMVNIRHLSRVLVREEVRRELALTAKAVKTLRDLLSEAKKARSASAIAAVHIQLTSTVNIELVTNETARERLEQSSFRLLFNQPLILQEDALERDTNLGQFTPSAILDHRLFSMFLANKSSTEVTRRGDGSPVNMGKIEKHKLLKNPVLGQDPSLHFLLDGVKEEPVGRCIVAAIDSHKKRYQAAPVKIQSCMNCGSNPSKFSVLVGPSSGLAVCSSCVSKF